MTEPKQSSYSESPPSRIGLSDLWAAAALFALVMVVHGLSRNLTPYDSRWVVLSSLSLLREGNLDLDEYRREIEANSYYLIECVGPGGRATLASQSPEAGRNCAGNLYYHYPLAVPILAAPIVWGVESAASAASPMLQRLAVQAGSRAPLLLALARGDLASISMWVEFGAACLFIAIATVLVYFACREDLAPAWSAVLALVFAFATSAWSIGSRGLWQHTLSMPLLALVWWLLCAARRRPSLAAWAGLPLMTSFWVRPTNVAAVGILSLFVFVFYRRQFAFFVAAMIPPVILFGAVTYSIYGTLIAPVGGLARVSTEMSLGRHYLEAIAANLWSPARGLFVFMPFVLLIPFCHPRPEEGAARRWLHWAAAATFVAQLLLVSTYKVWWGGHHYGPRYLCDLCPFFVFLSIPAASAIANGRRSLGALAIVLLSFSVFVHWRGANAPEIPPWNTLPANVDVAPWRIWDWRDLPFLRGLR